KAPVHTAVTYLAPAAWRRTKSTVSRSPIAPMTPLTPRNADQVKRRRFGKAVGWKQTQTTIAGHRSARLRRHNDPRLRQAGQHLQRPGEVELGQVGEQHKADREGGHK